VLLTITAKIRIGFDFKYASVRCSKASKICKIIPIFIKKKMQKEISLVLSGGGARGIAHIGVIQVLLENGFVIKNIAGTSMGALVGGIYAGGDLEAFTRWLVNADLKEAIKMLDFSLKLPGLIKAEKIMHKIESFLHIDEIEDLPIPYSAVATDINALSEVRFSSGKLTEAIRASIAIPTIFTPVFKEKQILLDGGLLNNIPLNYVPEKYPVIAVCVNADVPVSIEQKAVMNEHNEKQHNEKLIKIKKHLQQYLKNKSVHDKSSIGYAELLDKSIHLMIGRASQHIIAAYPPDLLVNISREICGTFDFLKAGKIVEIGRMATEKALDFTG